MHISDILAFLKAAARHDVRNRTRKRVCLLGTRNLTVWIMWRVGACMYVIVYKMSQATLRSHAGLTWKGLMTLAPKGIQ